MIHYKITKWVIYLMAVNINVINVDIKTDGDALRERECNVLHEFIAALSYGKSATSEENKVKSQHIFFPR